MSSHLRVRNSERRERAKEKVKEEGLRARNLEDKKKGDMQRDVE